MAQDMRAADRRFFKQMHDRFQRRLKDSLKERDWMNIEHQFLVYGMWLETEPDAVESNKKESSNV